MYIPFSLMMKRILKGDIMHKNPFSQIDAEQKEKIEDIVETRSKKHTTESSNLLKVYLKKVYENETIQKIRRFWKIYHITKSIVALIMTSVVLFTGYLVYSAKTADVTNLKEGLIQETVVYDQNGVIAGNLNIAKGKFVTLDEISPHMLDALLSTEDKRFYNHIGIDPIGIGRAVLGIVKNGRISGGGSTITQQLAKNAFLTLDQTFLRKAKELFLSFELEKRYSKDEIIEMYLNNVYYGNGAYGIENAAKRYFGKSAIDLTVPEAAVLAGSLKAPSYYNPIDNLEETINRRSTVLELMVKNGKLTQEEASQYNEQPIEVIDSYVANSKYTYPYYFDAVIQEITQNYGISEENLLDKGYQIYTGLNQDMQRDMEETFSVSSLFPKAEDGTLAQASSIALDPETGQVLAVVGGRVEEKHVFRGFNRATQLKAQPASTFKPLAVYTLALEEGYTPDSELVDEKRSYGKDQYTPENWNKSYQGTVTMTEAISMSWNAPAVWLLDKLGLDRGIQKVHQFGIATEKEDHYLGLALGGLTKGVAPIHLASAYTTFANKGIRSQAVFVTKIVDASGAVIVDNTVPKTNRVTSEKVADEMTKMLLSVFAPGGGSAQWSPVNYQLAGKSGTTESITTDDASRNQWMIGYTPDVVVATWMGYDDSKHLLSATSREAIGPLFKEEMNTLLTFTKGTEFSVEPASKKNNWFDLNHEKIQQTIQDLEQTGLEVWNWVKELTQPFVDRLNQGQ